MKPSIPKGTRDFSPQEMVRRNYIFDTIRSVFKLYGYLPIETPSIENLDTLMGKYGEEGDRLIFKILNSGDYLDSLKDKDVKSMGAKELTKFISEKALRYDLTVPFARYVVMHQNEITFPFKRYQIQPVWRADRPQKGRYREFYQCDADVIGSDSLLNEVELIQIINDVFTELEVPVVIKINNRKILQSLAEYAGVPDRMIDIAIAIDKLDKIGRDGINKEFVDKGFSQEQIEKLNRAIDALIEMREVNRTKKINDRPTVNALSESEMYKQGESELNFIFKRIDRLENFSAIAEFDPSLARGLNYYTGTIIEIKVDQSKCKSEFTSSIGGGGRYDDLTGIFGLKGMSGVGVSFGADRIYDVLEELNKFPKDVTSSTQVMFFNSGDNEAKYCLGIVSALRKAGISAELFPDAAKPKKQFDYAEKKKIPYVVTVEANDISENRVTLKNIITGEKKPVPSTDLIKHIV